MLLSGGSSQPVVLLQPASGSGGHITASGACAVRETSAGVSAPITFPNQNVTADQIVHAIYLNQICGKFALSLYVCLQCDSPVLICLLLFPLFLFYDSFE